MTLLEAAAALLDEGWAPARTLLFAFGHDEEVGGKEGAARIAALLRERGAELEVVWDEGSAIMTDGLRPFVATPVALVATAEKGYQSVEVSGACDRDCHCVWLCRRRRSLLPLPLLA